MKPYRRKRAWRKADGGASWAVVLAVCLALFAPQTAAAEDNFTLPALLSDEDGRLYREIFALQKGGNWPAADHRITHLSDRGLVGHVLAQRYLHPTHYRTSYAELSAWLAVYGDHPDADRLYKLALKRKSAKAKQPKRPTRSYAGGVGRPAEAAPVQRPGLSADQRRQARLLMAQIRRHLSRGLSLAGERLLNGKTAKAVLSPSESDYMQTSIATSYFGHNKDEKALALASAAAQRSGQMVPHAYWVAGLAAWRLGKLDEARTHFEAHAGADGLSEWMASAGAFWAARANLVTGRPENVSPLLRRAAAYPRTFYGLLAARLLGQKTEFGWEVPELTEAGLSALQNGSRGWRALALLQIGENDRAERELRGVDPRRDENLAQALLAIADGAELPALALRLGHRRDKSSEGSRDSALYPLPPWVPQEGYKVDPALIYAIMRQESGFNARAKSSAGAHGLMQLLPSTATFTAERERFSGNRRYRLYDPELNVTLGQKYLRYLLDHPRVQGDLFLLAVAYNGGLGNLSKWKGAAVYNNDPLLFIEAIPAPETRIFIERVLANLWIYRQRLEQPTPSLDALASGEWPTYRSLDGRATELAKNAEN